MKYELVSNQKYRRHLAPSFPAVICGESSVFRRFWMPPHRGAGQAPQVRHDEIKEFLDGL